jgi:hypothetical protein
MRTKPSSASGRKVSGTAGAITSISTTSRQIQFGLKLIWSLWKPAGSVTVSGEIIFED